MVYVSEGRNSPLLDSLAAAASGTLANVGLIREFRDPTYHRTGFTIGGKCPQSVAKASVEVSRRALRAIDLRMHEASHPRIGVVDHVSVHPLGEGGQQLAQEAGEAIGRALGQEEGLPVLLYGDLNGGRSLAEVRVELCLGGMFSAKRDFFHLILFSARTNVFNTAVNYQVFNTESSII